MNLKEIVERVYSTARNKRRANQNNQEIGETLHVMCRLKADSHGGVEDGFQWWLQDAISDALEVQPSQKEQLLGELEKKRQLVCQVPPVPRSQGERSSYDNIPPHLKRCLGFCTIFPKGWMFEREKLCRMWIAHGFIKESLGSGNRRIREEVAAEEYFDDLVERRLFNKIVHQGIKDIYGIPQEMHSMLRHVASDYCLSIDAPCEAEDIPPTIRHLSVTTDYVHQLKTYPPAWLTKLRTLLVFNKVSNGGTDAGAASSSTSRASTGPIDEVLKILKAVRVLDLSDMCITELEKSTVAELTNVRYIALPKTMKDLPGMERMEKLEWAGDIAVEGRRMNVLEKLNSLRGIRIKDLETVDRKKAKKARLSKKKHVEVLKLEWGHRSVKKTQQSAGLDLAVLDDLQPHPNLQKLYITFYAGTASPDWLRDHRALVNLKSLYLKDCRQLLSLPPVGGLPLLEILSVDGLHAVEQIDGAFCPAGGLVTKLDTMVLHNMRSLATWYTETAAGASGDDSRIAILFPKLKMVKITRCPNLTSLRGLLHCRDSLESLTVKECRRVAGTFSTSMFPKLTQKDCPGLFKGC